MAQEYSLGEGSSFNDCDEMEIKQESDMSDINPITEDQIHIKEEQLHFEETGNSTQDLELQRDQIYKRLVENVNLDIKKELEASKSIEDMNESQIAKPQEINHISKELERSIKEECSLNPLDKDTMTVINEQNLVYTDSNYENEITDVKNEPGCSILSDLDNDMDSTNINRLDLVKRELDEDSTVASYDYPQFDSRSIDSSEINALSNVDVCINEDGKNDEDYGYHYNMETQSPDNRGETDLTVTETHLISNKLINTSSTITHAQPGLIESNTTRTLIMEILPMHTTMSKIGSSPEQILPTTNDSYKDIDDTFQLNSITSDCLPLEAYGLLAKSKSKNSGKEKTHFCLQCPKQYTTKTHLRRHMKIHEKEKKHKKIKAKQEVKSELKEEMELSEQTYTCTCGKKFCRRTRMETCLRSHDEYTESTYYYTCTCGKEFKSKEDLLTHKKKVHIGRKKFPCKFCPTDYRTRKELFKHLRLHQKVQLTEYKVISELVEGKHKLKCILCNKHFVELTELKTHVMGDHKPPYKCPHCSETSNKLYDFATHVKTHPKIKNELVLDVLETFSKLVQAWKCVECNLQFNQADELAIHQVETHTSDTKVSELELEQYRCTDCRRVFASNKSLTSHKRVHHSTDSGGEMSTNPEPGLLCVYCRKICKDENALSSHMRFHSAERKYVCKFCDYRFATVDKRKTHSELHTGDMRYVCFICEYRCSSENRLKNHKLSVKHLSMQEFLLTGQPPEVKEPKKESEGDTKKRKLSRERSSSSKESICDICGEKFPTEELMTEHKLTHPFIEFPNEDQPSRIFFK